MKTSKYRRATVRTLLALGTAGMLIGALDPLEGSVIILAGSGLVTVATFLGGAGHKLVIDWLLIFGLILFGVAAMFVISWLGGFGGRSGRSMWWGLWLLPYPVGWVMGLVSLTFRLIRNVRHHHACA